MRELKFRAWDIQQNRMSKPFDIAAHVLEWNTGMDFDMPLVFFTSKERGVIMQDTGLITANSPHTPIFEGDYVKAGSFKGVVTYRTGAFFIDNEKLQDTLPLFEAYLLLAGDIRVLGNIYENPELLS